jgi:acetolactate synthase small subunit
LTLVGSPGGLTSVVQTFSTLNLGVERLVYRKPEGSDSPACLEACFDADETTTDLLRRKLARLIEVLAVEDLVTEYLARNHQGAFP